MEDIHFISTGRVVPIIAVEIAGRLLTQSLSHLVSQNQTLDNIIHGLMITRGGKLGTQSKLISFAASQNNDCGTFSYDISAAPAKNPVLNCNPTNSRNYVSQGDIYPYFADFCSKRASSTDTMVTGVVGGLVGKSHKGTYNVGTIAEVDIVSSYANTEHEDTDEGLCQSSIRQILDHCNTPGDNNPTNLKHGKIPVSST